jgi:hypothetical protein
VHQPSFGLSLLVIAILTSTAVPAAAQRFPFERSVDVMPGTALDVSTLGGKIDVSVGESARIQIRGTVTVRVAWNVPADASQIAQRVAEHPPVDVSAGMVRLRPPSDSNDRRAVIVSYEVRVPRDTPVHAESDSGAITIRDVGASLTVSTQSAAITLNTLGADADVQSGSGAVTVNGAEGALRIVTSSSAITARNVRGSFHARTSSGDVQGLVVGTSDVDVQTSSSGIRLDGLSGPVVVRTKSGRVVMSGAPGGPWDVSTGSGGIAMSVGSLASLTLDVASGSGAVRTEGLTVDGTTSKRRITGAVAGGGPVVRLSSRSGSIRVRNAAGS